MNVENFPLYPQWRKLEGGVVGRGGLPAGRLKEHCPGCRMCAVLKMVLNVRKERYWFCKFSDIKVVPKT